jgi:hypothetical protein
MSVRFNKIKCYKAAFKNGSKIENDMENILQKCNLNTIQKNNKQKFEQKTLQSKSKGEQRDQF